MLLYIFLLILFHQLGLFFLYKRYTHLRISYLRRRATPETFAVMVRECDGTEEEIFKAFDTVFPGKVQSVRLAYRTKWLWWMIRKREKIGLKAEKAQAKQLRGKKYYATNCEGGSCYICCGRRLEEPAEFFKIRYDETCEQIRFRQKMHDHTPARVAFVLFKGKRKHLFLCPEFSYAATFRSHFGSSGGSVPDKLSQCRLSHAHSKELERGSSSTAQDHQLGMAAHFSLQPLDTLITGQRGHICTHFLLVRFFTIPFWSVHDAYTLNCRMIPVTFVSGFTNLETLSEIDAFSWLLPLIESLPGLKDWIQG